MSIAIAYCIAALSTITLIVLWFITAYKELHQKRDAVYKAEEEMRLHQRGYKEKRGSPEESTAKHMLDTSAQIYEQIKGTYRKTFHNPIYRVPGILMGFKNIIK